jgi:hypothetical protein
VSEDLLGFWRYDCGGHTFLYQLWETEKEFVLECVYEATLQTLFRGRGNTPGEALGAAFREAMRTVGR